MRRALTLLIGIVSLGIAAPIATQAANPYGFTFRAGGGLPVGWWSERWGMVQSGELNISYEIQDGFGFFILTSLNKNYYADRSEAEIVADSRYSDRQYHDSLYTVITAEQGGAFKQLPVGAGFYGEYPVGEFRTYGSLAFVVNLWKFERAQTFEEQVNPPASATIYHYDRWTDVKDGSNGGFQFAAGVLYPLRKGIFLDGSLAYQFTSISRDNSAIAYWGKPARTWTSEQKSSAKNHIDFIALRLGIRFGG